MTLYFLCPIITQEPLTKFASNSDCGTWESHGNGLIAWFRASKLSRFYRKKTKAEIYDQVRVNDGSNNEYPEQRWVPKLVVNKAYVSESLIKEELML